MRTMAIFQKKSGGRWRNLPAAGAIFAAGAFSLVAQTLLFRDFLSVFDGSELSTGLFLFAWLLWVSIGALLGWLPPAARHARQLFAWLLLFYPATFILEKYLLLNTRSLLGVAEYELLPLGKLLTAAILFAAPVSLVTGALFVCAVKWSGQSPVPVAKIYVIETLGSFCGALMVTLLLFVGIADETVFLLAAAMAAGALGLNFFSGANDRLPCFIALLLALAFMVAALGGTGRWWRHEINRQQWEQMLPGSNFAGSFSTPQARYLYGDYDGGFAVLCWNSVYENLAELESALQCAALNLAQQPTAEHILVIGPGTFNLSRTLCKIKNVRQVVWLDPDPDYAKNLRRQLPAQFRTLPGPMQIPGIEIKRYLRTVNEKFDLVILNFPPPFSLELNRYFSEEFYRLIGRVMAPDGVVGVSFQGGEHYLGPEVALLGGALWLNLQQRFSQIALMPGENSYFWATAAAGRISESAVVLQERLKKISGLAAIFPVEYLRSVFDPLRLELQKEKYRAAATQLRVQHLSSSDANPLASFFALVFSVKKLGETQLPAAAIAFQARNIFFNILAVLILYGVLRLTARCVSGKSRNCGTASPFRNGCDCSINSFDILFILFLASFIAMALNIRLMFAFQTDQGAIFLYFGLVNACFMLGMFCGGRWTEFMQGHARAGYCSLGAVSLAFALFLLPLQCLGGTLPPPIFVLLFSGTGFFSGAYLPRAAYLFRLRGHNGTASAALLEALDCLGGAFGGAAAAMILLPLIGTDKLLLLALSGLLMLAIVAYRRTVYSE